MSTTHSVVNISKGDVQRIEFVVASANGHCCLVASKNNGNEHRSMGVWISLDDILSSDQLGRKEVLYSTYRLIPCPSS
jgi:hypothetical protein